MTRDELVGAEVGSIVTITGRLPVGATALDERVMVEFGSGLSSYALMFATDHITSVAPPPPCRVRIVYRPRRICPYVVQRRVGWFWVTYDTAATETFAVNAAWELVDVLDRKAGLPRIVREFA